MPRLLDHGMIQLVIDKEVVCFDPRVAEAERAGLTMSARLLKLARALVPERAWPGE